MALIVTVAQSKGGAGKTTVTAQLATAWANTGKWVGLVDFDPQGSLTAWFKMRKETLKTDRLGRMSETIDMVKVRNGQLKAAVRELEDYDIVLIDTPPHNSKAVNAAIRASNCAVVPIQPSPMDLWALGPTLKLAIKAGTPTLLVLNRVPPRANLTNTIHQVLKKNKLAMSGVRLGNRVAFAHSLMQGKGVVESAAWSPAAAEIRALTRSITSFLSRT